MAILNLTQHDATDEQAAAGVVDLPIPAAVFLHDLLTFDEKPSREDVLRRAEDIALLAAQMATGEDRGDEHGFALAAMIGGAPFLMAPLERALRDQGFLPVYAFSRRESVEAAHPDGSVRKTAVFRHLGFVEAAE